METIATRGGYYTHFTGAYVCDTCGHLCDPDLHEAADYCNDCGSVAVWCVCNG
jgi:hypothetical protein